MKKIFTAAISALLAVMCLTVFVCAEELNPVTVTLNGTLVDCASYGQDATIVEGRTLVPLRAIFEALGASVEWNGETRTVTSVLGETEIKLAIGENVLYKNEEAVELDVPAMIMNGRTMVPARAVAESFGVKVEWDSQSRTVVLVKEKEYDPALHAYGDFFFGMTRQDVVSILGEAEFYDDGTDIRSYYIDGDCPFADASITAQTGICAIDFYFDNDKLTKLYVTTQNGERKDTSDVLGHLMAYYGTPSKVVKDEDEYIWNLGERNLKIVATRYWLNGEITPNPEFGYSVEIEIKYTGKQFDIQEENTEDEKDEKEYLYGELYFGMGWSDMEKAVDKFAFRACPKHMVEIHDIFIELDDEDSTYNDEDEAITGKTNVSKLNLYVEDEALKNIYLETDPMTREEADFVIDVLSGRYGITTIATKFPETYEWRCKNKTVTLEVLDSKNYEDKEKAYYVTINYVKGKYVKNNNVNILGQIPLGLEVGKTSDFFKNSDKKVSDKRIEFFDVMEPDKIDFLHIGVDGVTYKVSRSSLYELYEKDPSRFNIDLPDIYGNVITNPVKKNPYSDDVYTYIEKDDIFGPEFNCSYISFDLVEGVCDNFYVKTVGTNLDDAAATLAYVAKYFGLDNVVYNEENQRYEWKNYKYPISSRGLSYVNIYSGVVRENDGAYSCYVSVQIAKEDRYSSVDESGRFDTKEYKKAYGNFYFGMTHQQAEKAALGDKKTEYNRIYVYDSRAEYNDEDKSITSSANADIIELVFDNVKNTLCSVKITTSELDKEDADRVLACVKERFGEEESADEKENISSFVWLDRESGLEIKLDVAYKDGAYVCVFSTTVAGSNIAKV